jgi:hypothetical protein
MQPFDRDQVYLSAEEILQVKGEVHEVFECRLLELHQDIYVAGLFLLSPSKGAEKANSLDAKAGLEGIMSQILNNQFSLPLHPLPHLPRLLRRICLAQHLGHSLYRL